MKKEDVLKFERDKTGELNKYFDACKNVYFPKLKYVNVNYIFRTVQEKDDEGREVIGMARRLPPKERDLYGYDFEICIHKDTWKKASNKFKQRIAWHELNHLRVQMQFKVNEPMVDKAGRIKIGLKQHDLVIRTFTEELEIFGPTTEQKEAIEKIQKFLQEKKSKIKRRAKI